MVAAKDYLLDKLRKEPELFQVLEQFGLGGDIPLDTVDIARAVPL